jgi:DNA polymerase-4
MDTFYVSCERIINPKFNNLPLIIGGGDRGVVASCSYEARKFGVSSGMPMRRALMVCPQATVIRGDMEYYLRKSHEVTQILGEKAPVMEKASVDEFYLDLTGMDRFHGSYKWTSETARFITKETGLPLSFALSVNKTVAKIGTGQGKPYGNLEIPAGIVRPFLDPLPVCKIPQVGTATSNLLSRIGIRQIRTLSETPLKVVQNLLGRESGTDIWKKANAIDNAPVLPMRERKSMSEERTFDQDTMDIVRLKGMLVGMVEKLCFQLRSETWLTSTVVVKVKYANFDTHTKQCRVDYTSVDHVLQAKVDALFDSLYNRRMRLRLVGVTFTGLKRGTYQIDLFDDTIEMMKLYEAMDRMKKRFGNDAVHWCAGLNANKR